MFLMVSIGARTAVLLTVSQTVSQNRAFDLFADSAKMLIRLKVRTGMVPEQGIELRPRAPLSKFKGPWTVVQVSDLCNCLCIYTCGRRGWTMPRGYM